MSKRIRSLERKVGKRRRASEDDDLVWLNRASFESDGLVDSAEWEELLNAMARRHARETGTGLVDAWIHVAGALAACVQDPEDRLYGITLAVHARNVGLRYEDAERFAELFRLYEAERKNEAPVLTGDDAEEAYQRYEFITNRLLDLETAISLPLQNDDRVEPDMLEDPEVIVASSILLWNVLEECEDEAVEEGREIDPECVDEHVRYSGHYLWAAHHAKRAGIAFDELRSFVIGFDEWFAMFAELVDRGALAAGTLAAMRDCDATERQLLDDGPELVALWRHERLDTTITLPDYLTQVLTAVEHDA